MLKTVSVCATRQRNSAVRIVEIVLMRTCLGRASFCSGRSSTIPGVTWGEVVLGDDGGDAAVEAGVFEVVVVVETGAPRTMCTVWPSAILYVAMGSGSLSTLPE